MFQLSTTQQQDSEPMTDTVSETPPDPNAQKSGLRRRLPLILLVLGAVAGAVTLKDYLSFQTLADNREALIVFRDANYVGTVAVFVALYAIVVAFSLPGATVMTLTGGFLFATFPGALFNVTGATLGAIGIFLAARWGLGEQLADFDLWICHPSSGGCFL